MELMYPIAVIICLILALIICFENFNKKEKYINGKRVANTKYIKETDYYKTKIKRYKILSKWIKVLSVLCIIFASFLVARPVTIQTKSDDKYNRDILLGLDISTSQCEVNLELINKFEEILPNIEGDRIGIILYNTAPVVYCPLTDDYEYINECFDKIEKQLEITIENNGYPPSSYEENGQKVPTIWYGGVSTNSYTRGSSLVGDGLAGTLFSFPNLKTDTERTRIIIFATDNYVSGTEMVSLEDACTLCKQYNINLYAYCPTEEMNRYVSTERTYSYKKAVEEKAGGKFYTGDLEQMALSIVNEIKETKTSLLKTSKKTYVVDHPTIFLINTIILFFGLVIIEKRIKL